MKMHNLKRFLHVNVVLGTLEGTQLFLSQQFHVLKDSPFFSENRRNIKDEKEIEFPQITTTQNPIELILK